jgi:hypothetical protein
VPQNIRWRFQYIITLLVTHGGWGAGRGESVLGSGTRRGTQQAAEQLLDSTAESLELLLPIADIIRHLEGGVPTISQLPRIWAFLEMHLERRWWDKYRSGMPLPGEVGWFAAPTAHSFPAVGAFREAVQERNRAWWHVCWTTLLGHGQRPVPAGQGFSARWRRDGRRA